MITADQISQAAHDALCDGGEEQHDVHVTHQDKADRVLAAVIPLIEQRAFSEFADRIAQLPTATSEPTASFIRLLRDRAIDRCNAWDYPVWADGSQSRIRCELPGRHDGSHVGDGGEWRWQD